PRGLQLAFATPRGWLKPGKTIEVDNAPTSFGRVSYSIETAGRSVSVSLDIPQTALLQTVRLRLRLPRGMRMSGVLLDGDRYRRFDPATEAIDLSGAKGEHSLEVSVSPRPRAPAS